MAPAPTENSVKLGTTSSAFDFQRVFVVVSGGRLEPISSGGRARC